MIPARACVSKHLQYDTLDLNFPKYELDFAPKHILVKSQNHRTGNDDLTRTMIKSIDRLKMYLNITNFFISLKLLIGGSFLSLQVKPPKILGGQSKKIEKSYKFSQKIETSGHQFGNSNYNSHWIYYLFNKLPTFAIMKID